MNGESLARAIALARQGKKAEAQVILQELVRQEPHNAQAWLWLADCMPGRGDRLGVLQEALRENPGHAMIQRAFAGLAGQGLTTASPAAAEPVQPARPPGGEPFSLSNEELRALDQKVEQESQETPAEDDWLRSLRLEARPVPPAPMESRSTMVTEPTTEEEPVPLPRADREEKKPAPIESRNVADFLASLEKVEEAKPAGAPPPQTSPASASLASHAADFSTPAVKSLGEEAPALAIGGEDTDEPPPRRRWLGVILLTLLGLVLVGLIALAWPTIEAAIQPILQPILQPIFSPAPADPAAAVVASETPTIRPSRTASPTPTVTNTPTPTATLTATVLPTITLTPPSPLVSSGVVASVNIQQFRPLAAVPAKGAVQLEKQQLAAVKDGKTVQIWDFQTLAVRAELTGPKEAIQSLAISPDGKLAAAASEEPLVWVWDIDKKVVIASLEFSKDLVESYKSDDYPRTLLVQFSPDGKSVVVGSNLGVSWWDLATRKEQHLFPLLAGEQKSFREQALRPTGQNATAFLVAFRPDGRAMAAGSPTKTFIFSWPGAGGLATLATKNPLVALNWVDNSLLSVTQPGQLVIWNTFLNKSLMSFPGLKSQPPEMPPNVFVQPAGRWLLIDADTPSGLPGGVRLVELPSGKEVKIYNPQTNSPVENPVLSPDGKLVFGRSAGDMFIWDAATGKQLRRVPNRRGFTALSPDGRFYLEVGNVETTIWGIAQP